MLQTTFGMIKSRAITQQLEGTVFTMILERGFIIRRAQMVRLQIHQIGRLYEAHNGKQYYPNLIRSVAGPVILLALEHENGIERWRSLMGPTDPSKAPPGTIRWLARLQPIHHNIVHGSDSLESAQRELHLMFGRSWIDEPTGK